MTPRSSTSAAALLAAAGAGIAIGALGYAVAERSPSPAVPESPRSADEARRAIAERVYAPGSVENLEQLAHLLARLGTEAIPAIAPTILDPGRDLDGAHALLLLQFWIDRDAKGAAEWIAKAAPLGYRSLALGPAIERIAESDPGAAVKFVGRAGAADARLLKPFVRGWVHSGEPGVEDWMRNLGYGFKRQKALGAFARAKIAKDGPAAVVAWLEALPENDGFREEAFGRVTSELAYADPAAGVAFYEKHRGGPDDKGLLLALVDAWVGVDGPAAMRWLSQQPAGAERDEAVLDGIRWWGVADIHGLKRWGREMGVEHVEPWFQPGLPIFARLYAADEPTEGLRWAERIADELARRTALVQIAREWRASDPEAAEAWIAESPLSEAEREHARSVSAPQQPKPAAPPAPAPG